MKLRPFLFILSLLIVFLLGISPHNSYSSNINTKEINILMPAPFADSTKELVNKYNKNNKSHIRINVTRGPLETEAVSDLAISSLLLNQNSFDLVLMDVTWLPKYSAANWLLELDPLIDKNKWSKLSEGAKRGNYYDQKLYRWPLVADMGLLYWRKDLMKYPPRTTKELETISQDLQSNNQIKYGYVWQGKQYEGLSCVFLEMVHGFGGEWLSQDGSPNLDSEAAIKASNWLKSLIVKGISPKEVTNFSETEALQMFESGDAAFMRNWPYAWTELQKETSKVKGNVGVSTLISDGYNEPTSTLGSWGLSVMKSSKNKQEAFEVLMYLSSKESQRYLFDNYGYTPTTEELYKDDLMQRKSPILPILKTALDNSTPRPSTPLYAQISDVLQRKLSSSLTGELTSEAAMKEANRKTRQILISSGKDI